MPVYDWQCQNCDATRETRQTISEYTNSREVPAPCECGGEFKRHTRLKESGCKGFILMDTGTGFHDHNYTRHRSIK
jgi:putative FmdB family regulatory protein